MNLQPARVLLITSSNEVSSKIKAALFKKNNLAYFKETDQISADTKLIFAFNPGLIISDFSQCDLPEANLYYDKLITFHVPIISIIPLEFLNKGRDFICPGLSDYIILCDETLQDIAHIVKLSIYSHKTYKTSDYTIRLEDEVSRLKKEKIFFIKELYHRVNNIFQIICSLLDLESNKPEDEETFKLHNSSINRIKSMSQIYSIYLQSQRGGEIDFEKYLRWLLTNKCRAIKISPESIDLKIDSKNITMRQDKIFGFGLILGELIDNSIKHGLSYKEKEERVISVKITQNEGDIALEFRDSGKGFPEGFNISEDPFTGLKLVKIIAENQLNGNISITNDAGGVVRVCFSN